MNPQINEQKPEVSEKIVPSEPTTQTPVTKQSLKSILNRKVLIGIFVSIIAVLFLFNAFLVLKNKSNIASLDKGNNTCSEAAQKYVASHVKMPFSHITACFGTLFTLMPSGKAAEAITIRSLHYGVPSCLTSTGCDDTKNSAVGAISDGKGLNSKFKSIVFYISSPRNYDGSSTNAGPSQKNLNSAGCPIFKYNDSLGKATYSGTSGMSYVLTDGPQAYTTIFQDLSNGMVTTPSGLKCSFSGQLKTEPAKMVDKDKDGYIDTDNKTEPFTIKSPIKIGDQIKCNDTATALLKQYCQYEKAVLKATAETCSQLDTDAYNRLFLSNNDISSYSTDKKPLPHTAYINCLGFVFNQTKPSTAQCELYDKIKSKYSMTCKELFL